MPLRPPGFPPVTQRDYDQWCRGNIVTPDNGTVTTEKIADHAVTDIKLRNSASASVIGRSAASPGAPSDITSTADGAFLVRRVGALVWDAFLETDAPATIARVTDITDAIAILQADPDPFPIYLTQAEGDTRYAEQSGGVFTGTMTGCTTTPTMTCRYSIAGGVIMLYLPGTLATSNTTALTITGAPNAIKPARAQTAVVRVQDNSVAVFGVASIDTGGVITFGVGAAVAAFTNSGGKGFYDAVFPYSLD